MGCKVERIANPFGFVGARLANGVDKNDTDIGSCSVFPDPQTLTAPFNLNSTVISATSIDLDWEYVVESGLVASLQIEISEDNIIWSNLANVNFNDTTYPATGLTPITTYYFRIYAVAVPPNINSVPSNISTSTTPAANPLDLFGVNLHAWFRADDVILSGGSKISQLNDKSGNTKHVIQPVESSQTTQADGVGNFINHKVITYPTNTEFMGNSTNWAGLGSDPFFIVIVLPAVFGTSSSTISNVFSDNDTSKEFSFVKHTNVIGFDWFASSNTRYKGLPPSPLNGSSMATFRSTNGRLWANGTEIVLNYDQEGTPISSFDTLHLGRANFQPAAQGFVELMFIKGNPEDYGLANGNAINKLYDYLDEEYPLSGIVSPNIP